MPDERKCLECAYTVGIPDTPQPEMDGDGVDNCAMIADRRPEPWGVHSYPV